MAVTTAFLPLRPAEPRRLRECSGKALYPSPALAPAFSSYRCCWSAPVRPPFCPNLGTQRPPWQELPLPERMGGERGAGRLCSLIGGVRLLSGGSQVLLPSQRVRIPPSTDGGGGLPNYQIKPSKHDVTPSILEGTFLDPGRQCLHLRMPGRPRNGCFQSSWDGCLWSSFIFGEATFPLSQGRCENLASGRSGWDEAGRSKGA